MGRKINGMFQIRKEGMLINFSIFFIAMALAGVISFLTMDEKSTEVVRSACVGGGAVTYFSMGVFFKIVYYSMESQRAVLFGLTRRTTFFFVKIFDFIEVSIIALLCAIIMPGGEYLLVFKLAILVYTFYAFLEAICGNCVIRFGKTAYIVCYIGIFVAFIGIPKILSLIPAAWDFFSKIVQGFTSASYYQGVFWGTMLGGLAVIIVIHWLLFRKIAVSSLAE
jgi:hypothetical protein